MRYKAYYYNYSDPSAPELTNNDGNIKTILKACLVTGYGTKDGAGWKISDETDVSMTLHAPHKLNNLPNMRIDNGLIQGEAMHRIYTDFASVNILTKDPNYGREWHLIASDFGFVFCYQMGDGLKNHKKNHIIFFGQLQPIKNQTPKLVMSNIQTSRLSGIQSGNVNDGSMTELLSSSLCDMETGAMHKEKYVLDTKQPVQGIAQPILWNLGDLYSLPFLCETTSVVDTLTTSQIYLNSRPFLKYANDQRWHSGGQRVLYIPLDYWEL